MKKLITTVKVLFTERLNNSTYGNPKIKITFENDDGTIEQGTTATDANYVYGLYNSLYKGDILEVTAHKTNRGKIIFDNIKKIGISE